MQQGGTYVYAVTGVPRDGTGKTDAPGCPLGPEDQAEERIGVGGGKVYRIRQGELWAVVSDLPHPRVRPDRRSIAAHHAVLSCLPDDAGVLPLTFGMVAGDAQEVQSLLDDNQEDLLAVLDRVRGRVEMGLRVRLNAPNPFEYYVDAYADLKEARDRLFGSGKEPTPDQSVALGRLFERVLSLARTECAQRVETELAPVCADLHRDDPAREGDLLLLACLIDRDGRGAFEEAVIRAAAKFDDQFAFDCSGPFPPHHFADIRLGG